MLKIENTYEDLGVVIIARNRATGADGESVTIPAGAVGEIEIDGDHQIVVTPDRGRLPGEDPLRRPPAAKVAEPEPEPELVEASDDQVKAVLADMKAEGVNLTRTGLPELPVVNAKLKDQGLAPIKAGRRDELFGALA